MANKNEVITQKHKNHILNCSLELFALREYQNVTMDDIAKHCDCSKRTLYEYFASKDEIYFVTASRSFACLLKTINAVIFSGAISSRDAPFKTDIKPDRIVLRRQFFDLCASLGDLYDENPLAFDAITQFSSLPENDSPYFTVLSEIYTIGEQINASLVIFFNALVSAGEVKKDLPVIPTIFMLWASILGIIKMARAKSAYLVQAAGMDRDTFAQYAFELLYKSITA